jgi:hypothetical protein
MRGRLLTAAMCKPHWGHGRLYWLLRRAGEPVNRTPVFRVYRELGVSVQRHERTQCALEHGLLEHRAGGPSQVPQINCGG